ncbi:MAG TPA: GNAT family N-acetyltransferase [Stellaceae bacterium]|nr:GNAT family N-acetyltransferase [Stellaceae bacterium]
MSDAPVAIAEERPDRPEVAELLRQSDAFAASLYPPEHRHMIDMPELLASNVHFFVARRDGAALGCMALVRTGPDRGELKRCFVTDAARGQGVGFKLLTAAEAAAREQAMRLIQLETGNLNQAALRLYRGNGFHERGPFGDYPDDGVSVFMEKTL